MQRPASELWVKDEASYLPNTAILPFYYSTANFLVILIAQSFTSLFYFTTFILFIFIYHQTPALFHFAGHGEGKVQRILWWPIHTTPTMSFGCEWLRDLGDAMLHGQHIQRRKKKGHGDPVYTKQTIKQQGKKKTNKHVQTGPAAMFKKDSRMSGSYRSQNRREKLF